MAGNYSQSQYKNLPLNQQLTNYGAKQRSLMGVAGHIVKEMVIKQKLRQFNLKNLNCLFIDGGQGGDVTKYIYSTKVYSVTLTDPFPDQLEKCKRKLARIMNKTKVNIIQIAVLDSNYFSVVKPSSGLYDIIDWQFAIHYSWSSTTNETICELLSNLLNPIKGLIVISCFDGHKLLEIVKKHKELTFQISSDNAFVIKYKDDTSYHFEGGDNPVVENYVFIDQLEYSLLKHDVKLVNVINFTEAIRHVIEGVKCDSVDDNIVNNLMLQNRIFKQGHDELRRNLDNPLYNEMLKYYEYMNMLIFSRAS